MSTPDGVLVVDKPAGFTSHDVVARMRRLAGTRRVGHAGTLDPMATGVLVLGIGRATKLLTYLVGCDKGYTATIRLGSSTVTDDVEGEVVTALGITEQTLDAVPEAVRALTGDIRQRPCAVSAIKVNGERAYARVRAGDSVELAERPVTVTDFEVVQARPVEIDGVAHLDLEVTVTVSSGTYVRALARDLGAALGVGGHLIALRRTRVGSFTLSDAVALADLVPDAVPVVPLAQAAAAIFPTRELTEHERVKVGYGQRIESAEPGRVGPIAALGSGGELVALLDESSPIARSVVVFAAN